MCYNVRMHGAVYSITNKINGKIYVGSTTLARLSERWRRHKSDLMAGRHHSQHLQRAWSKYGPDCFDFQLITACDIDSRLVCEQEHIDKHQHHSMNVNPNATNCQGRPCSQASRAKMSKSRKGKRPSATTVRKQVDTWSTKTDSVSVVSPDGTVFLDVRGWRRFAREHGLTASALSTLHRGVAKTVCGWYRLDTPPRTFAFVSPTGVEHRGIPSMRKFADEHGLRLKGLSSVHTGAKASHHGWTLATKV